MSVRECGPDLSLAPSEGGPSNGSETDLPELTVCDFWKETQEKTYQRQFLSWGTKSTHCGRKTINRTSSKVKPSALLFLVEDKEEAAKGSTRTAHIHSKGHVLITYTEPASSIIKI